MKRLLLFFIALCILSISSAALAQTPSLTIWTDDQRLPVITELSKQFTDQFGVDVTVTAKGIPDIKDALIQGAGTADGPNLFIIPHDNIGALVDSGVVAPIDLGDKTDKFLPNAIQAFTYEGKLYGVPFAIENIGFFRNTDLVPDAPKTWDEVATIGKKLVDDGKVQYAIALPDLGYNYYPVYTAFGGYIFGRDADGNYTATDLGMDNEGMAAGAQWASDLIQAGYVSNNLDGNAAYLLFKSGKTPFILTGPWEIKDFTDSGIPYAISAFPAAKDGGEPGAPFIGVQGFMVNANSANLLLAQTYLTEFIATDESMQYIFDNDPRPSAWVSIFNATDDPNMKGFAAAGANGQPMPAIPEMGSVWDAWGSAGTLIAQGQETPAQALKEAADQIRTKIKESSG
jgi:maltose-binding protein MalE